MLRNVRRWRPWQAMMTLQILLSLPDAKQDAHQNVILGF